MCNLKFLSLNSKIKQVPVARAFMFSIFNLIHTPKKKIKKKKKKKKKKNLVIVCTYNDKYMYMYI